MYDTELNMHCNGAHSQHRADCRIVPFILYRQVHPFSDGWLKMTWNVTVRFVFLHKILTVENVAKV